MLGEQNDFRGRQVEGGWSSDGVFNDDKKSKVP